MFTVADIPGLIEGAADGAGLGVQFLKHLSRCRILLHLVDATDLDAFENIFTIYAELKQFSSALSEKPSWIILNKVDAADPEQLQNLQDKIQASDKLSVDNIFIISGVTGEGVATLLTEVSKAIKALEDIS